MGEMISVEFEFRNQRYHALVRCRRLNGGLQIRVTVMNGEVEAQLFGNHIFRVDDSGIIAASECHEKDIAEIQQCIASGLNNSPEFKELYLQHSQAF